MVYDFNKIIDRHHTNCAKYDGCYEIFGKEDLLPLWVADMDFRTPDFIIDAIKERIKHPVLGYLRHSENLFCSIAEWILKRHQWDIDIEWIFLANGTMSGINYLIQAFTSPADKVIIQPPVYCPFYSVIENQGRIVVRNPLQLLDGQYEMDYNNLEESLKQGAKMMILCNPHNPIGRCWRKAELKKIGELCIKYNCLIVSDEVHSDVIMPGYKHIPIASLSEEIAERTITCMSPSKAFNIAGLSTSEIIIPNYRLREKYIRLKQGAHIFSGNIFGDVAMETCCQKGEEWLMQLIDYIDGNVRYINGYIKENIPWIKTYRHEATYLLWLDFSSSGLSHELIGDILLNKARVALSDGKAFGEDGLFHYRMNVACPRTILEEVMSRFESITLS